MKPQVPERKLLAYLLETMAADPQEFARIALAASEDGEHRCKNDRTAFAFLNAAIELITRVDPNSETLADLYWHRSAWQEKRRRLRDLKSIFEIFLARRDRNLCWMAVCYARDLFASGYVERGNAAFLAIESLLREIPCCLRDVDELYGVVMEFPALVSMHNRSRLSWLKLQVTQAVQRQVAAKGGAA